MKRLLLPLLAALALPNAVNADSHTHYLLIKLGYASFTVPMKSMEACEKTLNKALDKTNWVYRNKMDKPSGLKGICLSNK